MKRQKTKLTKAEDWLISFTLNHYDVLPMSAGNTDKEILDNGLRLLSHHYGVTFTREMLNEKFKG